MTDTSSARPASHRRLLTTIDAGAYLGYQPHTLETWRSRGEGPCFVRIGRAVRYEVTDLDAWVDAHAEPGEIVEAA